MNGVVVLETIRRNLTAALVVFLLLLVAVGIVNGWSDSAAFFWPPLVAMLAIGAGASLIGPEFSSGTLQLILVKPINRSVYLLSRFAGVVAVVWVGALAGFVPEAIVRLVWRDGLKLDAAAHALAGVMTEALLICALLALFGSFLRAYFNVGLYFILQIFIAGVIGMLSALRLSSGGIGAAIAAFVAEHPIIAKALSWTERNLFPDRPAVVDRAWVLMVLCNAAIALVLACLIFRRREVPYGAD